MFRVHAQHHGAARPAGAPTSNKTELYISISVAGSWQVFPANRDNDLLIIAGCRVSGQRVARFQRSGIRTRAIARYTPCNNSLSGHVAGLKNGQSLMKFTHINNIGENLRIADSLRVNSSDNRSPFVSMCYHNITPLWVI
jgi:hypothetical protein